MIGGALAVDPKAKVSLEALRLNAKKARMAHRLHHRLRIDELMQEANVDAEEVMRFLYGLGVMRVVRPADEVPVEVEEAAAPAAPAPTPAPAAPEPVAAAVAAVAASRASSIESQPVFANDRVYTDWASARSAARRSRPALGDSTVTRAWSPIRIDV